MRAEKRLQKMVERGSIPHLLLFSGQDAAKEKIALEFANQLVKSKTQVDIHHYHVDGKTGMHSILSMRQLGKELQFSPYESERHVFLIHDAERMLPSSSNALLKVFEEPPSQAVMILLVSHADKVLPTIVSRSQIVTFPSTPISTLTSLQKEMLTILKGSKGFKEIGDLVTTIDEEKKEWEKEMRSKHPPDLTVLQREMYEKEIEGASALIFQEKVTSLLETCFFWYRDIFMVHAGMDTPFLYFPEALKEMKEKKPLCLKRVEKAVKETSLAVERFMPLEACFEGLFLKFEALSHVF